MNRRKSRLTILLALAAGLCLTMARAEQTEQPPGRPAQPASYFYTGKPYDADVDAYVFAYRSYNAELNRWTTPDPSGFPDGANPNRYAPVPTSNLDSFGLAAFNTEAEDLDILQTQINSWNNAGWTFAANVLSHFAGNSGTTYTGSATEAAMIKDAAKYRKTAKDHFKLIAGQYLPQGDGTYNVGTAWDGTSLANEAFGTRWKPADDGNLFNALGGAHFLYVGTLTVSDGHWSVDVTMEQADLYTFMTPGGYTAAVFNAPPSGRATWDLEKNYNYNRFWNYESWQDQFAE